MCKHRNLNYHFVNLFNQLIIFLICSKAMLILWILMIILLIVILTMHLLILNALIEFEVDHVNPIDLCTTLEKRVNPTLYIQGFFTFLTIWDIKRGWPLLIFNLLITIGMIYLKKTKKQIFDPMTIVRDMAQIEGRHIICIVVCAVSFVYTLVQTIFVAFL